MELSGRVRVRVAGLVVAIFLGPTFANGGVLFTRGQ